MAIEKRLHLDSIANNKNNSITISILGASLTGISNTIKGFITSDTNLGGGNSYNAPFDSDLDDINKYVARGSQLAGAVGFSNFIIKSVEQTVYAWTGSERFQLPLELLFISYTRKDKNVLNPLKILLSAVTPVSTGSFSVASIAQDAGALLGQNFDLSSVGTNLQTIAPMGYRTENIKGIPIIISGGCAVEIGSWFKANNLIIKSMSFTISKETLDDGRPLYGTASIVLESFKMLSQAEVLAFILDPSAEVN